MTPEIIFFPSLVHMLLIIFLYTKLSIMKAGARAEGGIDLKGSALGHNVWPDNVQKVTNNIANQFEIPVLFHVLVVIFYVTGNTNIAVIGLSVVFVASRFLHTFVHIGRNHVSTRRRMFAIGMLVIVIQIIWLIAVFIIGY